MLNPQKGAFQLLPDENKGVPNAWAFKTFPKFKLPPHVQFFANTLDKNMAKNTLPRESLTRTRLSFWPNEVASSRGKDERGKDEPGGSVFPWNPVASGGTGAALWISLDLFLHLRYEISAKRLNIFIGGTSKGVNANNH